MSVLVTIVGGVSVKWRCEYLESEFNKFGICTVRAGPSRDTFVVKYDNPEDAKQAILYRDIRISVEEFKKTEAPTGLSRMDFSYSDIEAILSKSGVGKEKTAMLVGAYVDDTIHQKSINLMKDIYNTSGQDLLTKAMPKVQLSDEQIRKMWLIFTPKQMLELYNQS